MQRVGAVPVSAQARDGSHRHGLPVRRRDVRYGCAPCKGGALQWVKAPPGNRSSRKQSEQSWSNKVKPTSKKLTAYAATLFTFALFVITALRPTTIALRMALKQLMAAVIRPWSHAGPQPPVSADRARSVPRPGIPAMPWVINESNHTHESSFVSGKNPLGIDWPG